MSRLEWILTGLLGILVVAVVILVLLFWAEQRQVENVNRQVVTQVPVQRTRGTAQTAYEVAAPAAQAWAADAALLHARGTWPAGTSFEPANASWGFLFYSPQRQAVALVATSGDEGRIVSESEAEERFIPDALGEWQVDSPEVVETVLANGGRSFIQEHGESSLIVALNATEQLVWTATLNATNANKLLRLRIDPINGQVIR